MKVLLAAVTIVLIALGIAGCVSVPNDEDDEQMWSASPGRSISDPDARDGDL